MKSNNLMDTTRLCFIGGGNMAFAIVAGLLNAKEVRYDIQVIEPADAQRDKLLARYPSISVHANAESAALSVDAVILAVKPQIMQPVCQALSGLLDPVSPPCVISIAAGVRTADIGRWLGRQLSVIRVMPNQGALIGLGSNGLFANAQSDTTHKQLAERVMRSVGGAVWADSETDIDSITAVSGSGPAYFFLLMEMMQQVGIEMGLSTTNADQLVRETAIAAAMLAQDPKTDVRELRRSVTSPGGTTAAAIDHLLDNGVEELFKQALQQAKLRASQLADMAHGED